MGQRRSPYEQSPHSLIADLITAFMSVLLALMAGLMVTSIALTPGLRDWGMLVGHLGTLRSPCLAG
jgi:hypothetical protein